MQSLLVFPPSTMRNKTQAVAMTDPQLSNNNANNNNNNNNTNNNNDGEPKYLHKKFKKMATTEVSTTRSTQDGVVVSTNVIVGTKKDCKEIGKTDCAEHEPEPETEIVTVETGKKNYLCPYCKLSCAKPSVLQKHIRAHTNERPYPCVPCGFAFKTKSNLYKHCRSRAHILKMEEGDTNNKQISEDSDISLSDSASNGTGTPPPGLGCIATAVTTTTMTTTGSTATATLAPKTVKTGKIYKPKFHTALQSVNNQQQQQQDENTNANAVNPTSFPLKPNAEQVQEHIDRIITDNQAIVEAVDPRLHKLMLRQAEAKQGEQQPLNLTTDESILLPRKRSLAESYAQQNGKDGSVVSDLTNSDRESETDNFICGACSIAFCSADNLDAHQRFYCKGTPSSCPRKANFHLDLEKKDDINDTKSDYYNGLQPLPSPGPLLGNTRLVDAYPSSSPKKPRNESVPTSLRSLEELSKYPRPNSLQMFGGEVRILDNSGETKTMRIDPCQSKSPSPSEQQQNSQQQQQHQQQQHGSGKCPTSSGTTSVLVRSGLHSGGMMVHKSPLGESGANSSSTSITLASAPKILAPIVPNISKPNLAPTLSCYSNYLEPHINPLTSITAYNPLTLPQPGIASILHAGKYIPYVPGMPGPHSLSEAPAVDISPNLLVDSNYKVVPGLASLQVMPQPLDLASPVPKVQPLDLASPAKDSKPPLHPTQPPKSDEKSPPLPIRNNNQQRTSVSPIDVATNLTKNYKPQVDTFYGDPSPKIDTNGDRTSPFNKAIKFSPRVISTDNTRKRAADWPIEDHERIQNDDNPKCSSEDRPKTPEDTSKKETSTKFLRPTSLPLKPGTFVPKKHHGITPTSNTIPPLISPETPRPKKSYGQLYLNGHAYTYLGMKCSTRLFYCTLNRPQPMYVLHQHALSMYSNWKINMESPSEFDMAHYDSRNRHSRYSIAAIKLEFTMTHSSHRLSAPKDQINNGQDSETQEKTKKVKICDGGFESNEDYTYVRGRGRGRYVCNSCGIRCKKPSMLKKHIRTHTDVRPYTCKHCSFSFKTKGNLTKHMKSKAHYKKCVELNIVPVPTVVCDENIDKEAIARLTACGENAEESSEEEEESEGDESEEQESGNEEQEAAQSLLSLSQPNTAYKNIPGLLPVGRPCLYPYKHNLPSTTINTICTTTTQSTPSSTVQSATVIQNEHANRYYFPSNRNTTEESKLNVSEETEGSDIDVTMEGGTKNEEKEEAMDVRSTTASQPMDLTTKQVIMSPIQQRAKPADILTPVSEPVLLQTLVQTMERLPIQGNREWKPEAQEGHMLQAYLTERHVMDSKIKQQYRVGNSKLEKSIKDKNLYLKNHNSISRANELNGVVTVSYTNPTKIHPAYYDSRLKSTYKSNSEEPPVNITSETKLYPPTVNSQFDLKQKKEPRLDTPKPPFFERSNYSADLSRSAEIEPKKPSYGLLVPVNCPITTTTSTQDSVANSENRPVHRVNNIATTEYAKVGGGGQFHGTDARNLYPPTSSFALIGNTQNSVERNVPTEHEGTTNDISLAIKHSVARKMVVGSPGFRPETPPVGNAKPQAIVKPHFLQNSNTPAPNYVSVTEDGRSVCGICNKVFSKSSQLKLHINIHYFERPFKCESCGVSFRTKGHLTKHERSVSHHNKVSMTSTFGAATTSNPRPFKCGDCKVAFRIHGHLAKHLRSKMHIMRLECLGKLPFGCYAEMERSGVNLNDIDTTDCDNSLTSLQMLAQRMYENDPSKVKSWDAEASRNQAMVSGGETSSDEGEAISQTLHRNIHGENDSSGIYRQYNVDESSNNQQGSPNGPTTTTTTTTSSTENLSVVENGNSNDCAPVRCQICAASLPSLSDLQLHNFVEHNTNTDQENTLTDKRCENT